MHEPLEADRFGERPCPQQDLLADGTVQVAVPLRDGAPDVQSGQLGILVRLNRRAARGDNGELDKPVGGGARPPGTPNQHTSLGVLHEVVC